VTAYRWFWEEKLPISAHRAGRLILVDAAPAGSVPGVVTVYARVWSAGQRADLGRQVAWVTGWAAGEGLAVGRGVTEAGAALNGRRRKFLALLRDEPLTVIVAEHRDRFARFGAEYVEAALSVPGCRVMVMDPAELDGDLVRDVTGILTSLCAGLCGRGAAAPRAERAVAVVTRGAR